MGAVLMPSAKADEVTIVQIESEGYNKQKVVVPICAMKGGSDLQQYVDLLIPSDIRMWKLMIPRRRKTKMPEKMRTWKRILRRGTRKLLRKWMVRARRGRPLMILRVLRRRKKQVLLSSSIVCDNLRFFK